MFALTEKNIKNFFLSSNYCRSMFNAVFFQVYSLKSVINFKALEVLLPAIERPGLESQRSRKRLFFHRRTSNSLKFEFICIICDIRV